MTPNPRCKHHHGGSWTGTLPELAAHLRATLAAGDLWCLAELIWCLTPEQKLELGGLDFLRGELVDVEVLRIEAYLRGREAA